MNGNTNLRAEAQAAEMLLSAMRAADSEFSDEDAELVVASETSLTEAIEAALVANAEDEAHVEALKALVATHEARAARKAARVERRKGAILAAMEIAGLAKLELAAATVSVGKGRAKVIVTDEDEVPDDYKRHSAPKPDLTRIAAALKAGEVVRGAVMSNAMPTLTVRSR